MMKKFGSPNMEKYFHSLPLSVQEGIMQCGIDFKTEEDMRATVMQLVQVRGVQ